MKLKCCWSPRASSRKRKRKSRPRRSRRSWPSFSGGRDDLNELLRWLRVNFEVDIPFESLADLDREVLERRITGAVEDKLRPEIRGMERALVLQLLDTAWKEHLLAMDHLRSSVGFAATRKSIRRWNIAVKGCGRLKRCGTRSATT